MTLLSDPILERVKRAEPSFWSNPGVSQSCVPDDPLGDRIDEAEDRLRRAAGLLVALFPSLVDPAAPLRSPLLSAAGLGSALGLSTNFAGRMWLKADHRLPVAGSVKARGGFHEVIAVAERIALREGLISPGSDLAALAGNEARALFSRYSIAVGSTGNLGMSIGIMASALGFRATVHMSSDAKAWKKQRLRHHGAQVVEHDGDYAQAVLNGRRATEGDPFAHFVDDEQSIDLFAGYAAVAGEVAVQLRQLGIVVDADHPLFVYIPCGVGGAPGGISYGLKREIGPHVHCVFAEPVQSPCMLVQLASGGTEPVSVYDMGLTNRTEADGLAVGQASMLVAPLMRHRLDVIYTLSDEQLYALVRADDQSQQFGVEPSAAACFAGPIILRSVIGRAYLAQRGLDRVVEKANHIMWATGGSLIPDEERKRMALRAQGAALFDIEQFR